MLRHKSNKYGKSSLAIQKEINPLLVQTFEYVLPIIDHGLVIGKRDKETQNTLYANGLSQLQWPESKHNVGIDAGRSLADAVDAPIYLIGVGYLWGNIKDFEKIARKFKVDVYRAKVWFYMEYARYNALLQARATELGYDLRWGGDWNSDNGILDQSFDDFFHWEFNGYLKDK